MTELPEGTITFLFTDIEGSTPLWEREPRAMQASLKQHNAILRKAIDAHGGQVYKIIGDAFQAAFPLPHQAVEAAIAAGVTAVVQPGGSVRDSEVIAACDAAGAAMVFTGRRHFRH